MSLTDSHFIPVSRTMWDVSLERDIDSGQEVPVRRIGVFSVDDKNCNVFYRFE